ncbi:hypothetical protein C3F09_04770 [candidate division GN15 bacterium]|uniref:Uncharacterized protein n=1 Tax=candidate division GN15 bacterium TaxID=2072418 RepID=A0A855X4L0_9BACT|nr:MAG: hypothetical protein C3F09_04770 [candidate division GN15 bacterium]
MVILMVVLVALPVLGQDKPIQLSLFSPVQLVKEDRGISGVRLSLLYGKNTHVSGLDWGLVSHCTSGMSQGVQFGLVGLVNADFTGFQATAVNITKHDFEGFQWGIVNYAGYANGFQLGLVNYAQRLKGLQIGLVNIIKQGGQFPVFPIVNWSF